MYFFRSLFLSNRETFSLLLKWRIGDAAVGWDISPTQGPQRRLRSRWRLRAEISRGWPPHRWLVSTISIVGANSRALVDGILVLGPLLFCPHHIRYEFIKIPLFFLGPLPRILNEFSLFISNFFNSLNFLFHKISSFIDSIGLIVFDSHLSIMVVLAVSLLFQRCPVYLIRV